MQSFSASLVPFVSSSLSSKRLLSTDKFSFNFVGMGVEVSFTEPSSFTDVSNLFDVSSFVKMLFSTWIVELSGVAHASSLLSLLELNME